ncbi:hypothetical protein F4777DRAFT_584139 [Nemania sp. FL0916]|nr:hypothetical protein F4777DRAFT_584139 [Nemania sp. FL0916]
MGKEKDPNFEAARLSWRAAADIFRRLLKIEAPYLTDQDLKDVCITCTDLDLETGKPADGSETFIRPMPAARIHSIIKKTKPWLGCPLLEKDEDEWPEYAAMHVHYCLKHAVHAAIVESRPIDDMAVYWEMRCMRYDEGERLDRHELVGTAYEAAWSVHQLFEKMDPSTPHISCLLRDGALLQDDKLSHAEIMCILIITLRRWRDRIYNHHRIIPVTVVSAADRQLRIVQGYVDDQDGHLHVRKSPMLDFSRFEQDKVELVVSWCVGDAVGDTLRHDVPEALDVGRMQLLDD